MSTGSKPTLQLKAAPRPDQLTNRLDDGPWGGIEIALMPDDVVSDDALDRAVRTVRDVGAHLHQSAVTAEAPVAWPSGASVRVDRLDGEARGGIERSAEFAARIGSPVLTIHLFVPLSPDEFRAAAPVDEDAVEAFLRLYPSACTSRGVIPLVENVPPILRMRTGGVFLSPIGGHWRDLLEWRERLPDLRFTVDTSHAALFRSFVAVYPGLFGLESAEHLELERYVEELGPCAEVAHVSDAHGLLGEGLPYGAGELDLDPVVRRLSGFLPFIVAEINEPDPGRSVDMKRAYAANGRARPGTAPEPRRPPRPVPLDGFDWQ